MDKTIIFPAQEVAVNTSLLGMFPAASIIPAPFTMELGKTYAVQWGDTLFENLSVVDTSDGIPGSVAIGNGSILGYPGNNEPFAIAYFSGDSSEIMILFLDGNESQTVTVYREGAEGGGEEETTNPIVLKDRTGTGIEYEGVEGVRVFDKAGNPHVFVPPVETEEKTVDLDFSGGAMEVTPTAGKLLSKVDIPVPDGLIPENISEGIRIAGIDGALKAGGGGGMVPVVFTAAATDIIRGYVASSATYARTITAYFPPGSTIFPKTNRLYISTFASSYSTQTSTTAFSAYNDDVPTPTVDPGYLKVSLTINPICNGKYYAVCNVVIFRYSILGLYIKSIEEGGSELYADETCLALEPSFTTNVNYSYNIQHIKRADLSRSQITTIPAYFFFGCNSLREVILPATVTEIKYCAFRNNYIETIDLSRHTFVPTLNSSGFPYFSTASENLKILVPSALYDEFIAATNWSTYASRIVPV